MLCNGESQVVHKRSDEKEPLISNTVDEDPVLDVREFFDEREDHHDVNEDIAPKPRKARIEDGSHLIIDTTDNSTIMKKQCITREKPMANVTKVPVLECSVR